MYDGILFCSPQKSATLSTMVTAIVEIHCLRSSEQGLLAKLKSAMEKPEAIFEPSYIKFKYPSKLKCFDQYKTKPSTSCQSPTEHKH